MKSLAFAVSLLAASSSAFAVQETLTTAGVLDCSAVTICSQKTADGLFTLKFAPTYPTSAPSAVGFNVYAPAVEIYSNGASGFMDLNILQMNLTASNFFNGQNYIGAIQLEKLDATGTWSYVTQWSTYISSVRGVYVMFNGRNALSSPFVKGVKAIRLTGVNGATAFKIGLLNATPY
jgi:hypothetical protein